MYRGNEGCQEAIQTIQECRRVSEDSLARKLKDGSAQEDSKRSLSRRVLLLLDL